mgnify:FL=1
MPGNQSPAPPYFYAKSNIKIRRNEAIRLQVLREKFKQEDGVQGLRNLFNRSNPRRISAVQSAQKRKPVG